MSEFQLSLVKRSVSGSVPRTTERRADAYQDILYTDTRQNACRVGQ
ncbi:hypothetical protein OKW50_006836 [Paraburkholderia youngii]|uniref:Uncharacterized protein n=1 Tax=Paraburkholderia youngii TaxID=2782701 RepID=A0A7W8P5H2_9BURK|nr:hypothetical protein [Paraburkholderia youngii]